MVWIKALGAKGCEVLERSESFRVCCAGCGWVCEVGLRLRREGNGRLDLILLRGGCRDCEGNGCGGECQFVVERLDGGGGNGGK